jgi:XRE family transcriptional regulator, regulator of sulfur utilization
VGALGRGSFYPNQRNFGMPVSNRNPRLAKAFGSVIRKLRLDQQISQEQLALDAEVDRSYLGRLERGEKQPSLDIVFRLAAALGVRASVLVEEVTGAYSSPKSKSHSKK